MIRALWPVTGVAHEVAGFRRVASDRSSLVRFAGDSLLYRVLRIAPHLPGKDREREVSVKGGTRLRYRLNRGDIWTVREVWIDEIYRMPGDFRPETVIDLGANIGLTTTWLGKTYDCSQIIAVEPSPANVRLLRHNTDVNAVPVQIVEAAVAAGDGTARFHESDEANLGRLGENGSIEVETLSMSSLLERTHVTGPIDLLKIDVEGAEYELFAGDVSWLRHVSVLWIEFHPTLGDGRQPLEILSDAGFVFVKPVFMRSDITGLRGIDPRQAWC